MLFNFFKKNFFSLYLVFFFIISNVYSISVSPQRYELFLSEGEEKEIRFLVVNDRDFEQEIMISSTPWHILEENKNINTEEWFSYKPQKLFLKPKEEAIVICSIKCPKQAVGFLNNMLSFTEGQKYAGIISLIITVPVYVIIKDKSNFDIEISSLIFRTNPVSKKNEILVGIENKGNVYIRPKGKVEIYKTKKLVYSYTFGEMYPIFVKEKGYLFLPYEEKNILKDGKYKVCLELNLWDSLNIKKEKDFVIKNNLWILKN